jgi:hypothetical protein
MLIVVAPPRLTFYPRVVQAQEAEGVQLLGWDAAVEGFGKSIVSRLAGPAEVQHHIVLVSL